MTVAIRDLDGRHDVPIMAWFKHTNIWVTLCSPGLTSLTRSASEGSRCPRLRFGLGCRGVLPEIEPGPAQDLGFPEL
jgi:hypothetical protein